MTDLPAELQTHWQSALRYWSAHPPELPPPRWLADPATLQREGLGTQLAQVRLQTRQVQLNGPRLRTFAYLPELLAHEAGHLLYSPASLLVHRQGLLLLASALPGRQDLSVLLNLWQDLLINTCLWQRHQLDLLPLFAGPSATGLWPVILRACERLWRKPPGSLTTTPLPELDEADALELAEQLEQGLKSEIRGLEVFARICARQTPLTLALTDSACGDQGAAAEEAQARLSQLSARHLGVAAAETRCREVQPGALDLPQTAERVAFYRQLARPFLRPWRIPMSTTVREPVPESFSPWQFERPLTEIAWTESLFNSPRVLPGLTTVRQQSGDGPEQHRRNTVQALDLYLDGSSSRPDPARELSRLALCGVILTLSALHQGWRVRVTLWSGPQEALQSSGWSRAETELLALLTTYPGGATCFPQALLAERYRQPPPEPVHLAILSDQGLLGAELHELLPPELLQRAGGGASLILDWPEAAPEPSRLPGARLHLLHPHSDFAALVQAVFAHV